MDWNLMFYRISILTIVSFLYYIGFDFLRAVVKAIYIRHKVYWFDVGFILTAMFLVVMATRKMIIDWR